MRAQSLRRALLTLAVAAAVFPLGNPSARASTWAVGDVFAAIGSGMYSVYSNDGAFKETVGGAGFSFTTGCAFDRSFDFYATDFSDSRVVKLDGDHPHGVVQVIDDPRFSATESIVFAANGDFYTGGPGDPRINRYNPAGVLQQSYTAAPSGTGGADWMDLAADQKTMFYASEDTTVRRFDVSGSGTDLGIFANVGSGSNFALRLLPPGDGSGGLLVASFDDIKRLNGSGAVVQTYDSGVDGWFSLNLDPNGRSFWAGSFHNNSFYRFNISSGAVEVGPIATNGLHYGLCLLGEPTAAIPTLAAEGYAARVRAGANDTGKVAKAAIAGPGSDDEEILGQSVGPVSVSVGRSTAGGESAAGRGSATASSRVAGLDALGGLVTAEAVKAIATVTRNQAGTATSSQGSGFVRLTVNGVPVSDSVPANTAFPIPGVGTLTLREEAHTGDSLLVRMIHFVSADGSVDVVVASAYASVGGAAPPE